ncbi:MAG: hypothetical protein JXA90_16080 [Planctomycetes bacterium]|nr:hypothetical protein [Planctomycetota bacterium]
MSDGPVTVSICSRAEGVQGWAFGLCHEPSSAELVWFRSSAELATIRSGSPPGYYLAEEAADGSGVIQAVVLDLVEHRVLPSDTGQGFPVLEAEYDAIEISAVRLCDGLVGSGQPVDVLLSVDGATYRPQEPAETTLVPKPEAWFDVRPEISNGPVTAFVNSAAGGIQGWSFSLCHDPNKASVASFESTHEVLTINHGKSPDFLWVEYTGPERNGYRAGIIQACVPVFGENIALPGEVDGGFPVLAVEYDVEEESSVSFCENLIGSGQPVSLVVTIRGESSQLPMQHASTTLIVDPYSETLAYRVEPPESGEVVTVKLYSAEALVEGWAFTLCHTAANAEIIEMQNSPELDQLVAGEPPEFVANDIREAAPFVAVEQRVVLGSSLEALALGPFPEGIGLLDIRYNVVADDHLKFCDHVGSVTFDNYVTIDGIRYTPKTREGGMLVEGALATRFIRGDADLSGGLNVTDPVVVLSALFLGGSPLVCLDAADANDVGRVDISDPIFVLRYLFLGGPPPPPPFPHPGVDLSPETSLGCERGL